MRSDYVVAFRLQIRTDEDANLIRAYLMSGDGPGVEISTLSLALARLEPDVFTAWKEMCKLALSRAVAASGGTVVRTYEEKPHESN